MYGQKIVQAGGDYQDDSGKIRPDFILAEVDERIVLEVYTYKKTSAKIKERKQHQMLRYLQAAKTSSGIIFMYSVGRKHPPQKFDHINVSYLDAEHMIVYVLPRPRSQK